jgi:hypothetical protein
MRIARICNEWDLNFNIKLKDEEDKNLYNRSYIHYATSRPDLVACKAYATKWLLKDIIDEDREYSVLEFMSGIGIQTLIIQKIFKVKTHIVNELDRSCVDHLSTSNFPSNVTVICSNANDLYNTHSDLKFMDFPNSSIIRTTREWKTIFDGAFSTKPKLVVWTDTSISYSMKIHGKKYGKIFDCEVNNTDDYIKGYSDWLYMNFGYSIIKAAFRHRNAVYFAAIVGKHETETEYFKLGSSYDGFYFLDDKRATLEKFM